MDETPFFHIRCRIVFIQHCAPIGQKEKLSPFFLECLGRDCLPNVNHGTFYFLRPTAEDLNGRNQGHINHVQAADYSSSASFASSRLA
jgi:hypothetical protein